MAQSIASLRNPSPPSGEQMARMTATLTHHISRLEHAEPRNEVAVQVMTDTLRRIHQRETAGHDDDHYDDDRDRVHRNPNSSFSDTFSESFLCNAEAAAVDAVAGSGMAKSQMTPSQRLAKKGKRKTEGLQWTPLHGIRRKAALPLAGGDMPAESQDCGEDIGSEAVKMNPLDSSIDLFD